MQRAAIVVVLAVALFGAMGADARLASRGRAVLGSDLESWQHMSEERLMTLGVWKDLTCPFKKIPNFDYEKGFAEYCKQYGKVYKSLTYPLRFALWKAAQNCVYARNAEARDSRFFLRVNAMHDMTDDEFKKTLGLRVPENPRFRAKNVLSAEDSVERSVVESLRAGSSTGAGDAYSGKSFDWRTKGVFNPVAFQGQCGSCWAWTSATLIEAAWKIAGNPLPKVSVQQILWCSDPKYCHGCFGGFPSEALRSVKEGGGVCTDAAYPEDDMSGECKTECQKVVQISEVRSQFRATNENDLFEMLKAGPVGVGVSGENNLFRSYGGGVFDDPNCNRPEFKVNHAVVLVGYGTDPAAGDYWILRNSWGTGWGEEGYMRIRRGVNQCKIMNLWAQAIAQKAGASRPSTPTPAAPTSPVGAMCKTASAPIRYGVCQDVTSCLDIKGTPTRGLCSGASNIQCCLGASQPTPPTPTPTPTPTPNPSNPVPAGPSCLARHPTAGTVVPGSCIDAALCTSTSNVPVRGACHGTPANIQCCLPKSP